LCELMTSATRVRRGQAGVQLWVDRGQICVSLSIRIDCATRIG